MIYAECGTENAIAKKLCNYPRNVRHKWGKAEILKHLDKDCRSKGLIDEDPSCEQPPLMDMYHPVRLEGGIRILKDERKENFLIILCPRMEEWIIEAAKESGVELGDYGLPDEPDRLREESRASLGKFKKLVDGLKNSRKIDLLAKFLNDEP